MLAFAAPGFPNRALTRADPSTPLVYIVAGEASGDNLAARLMAALRRATGDRVRFAGIGGAAMAAEGLSSLFPMRELSLLGMTEVLPHLPRLIRCLRATTAAIEASRPAVVVTVDCPGFSFRVAKRIRRLGIPLIHYVAPQLWAWHPGRGRALAGIVDHLLALLPFEPEFFKAYGVRCTFVGHPAIEAGYAEGSGTRFRARHGIPDSAPLVVALPGSRRSEIRRLLPVFGRALDLLGERHPGVVAAIPLVDSVADAVRANVAGWRVPLVLVDDAADKIDAFAASTVAITKSGTATLELAIAGVPMVAAYRVSPLTAMLARRLLRVDDVTLVNLLAGERLVPEFLQERCRSEAIAAALSDLLDRPERRRTMRAGLRAVVAQLGDRSPGPSARAAEIVLSAIAGGARQTLSDR